MAFRPDPVMELLRTQMMYGWSSNTASKIALEQAQHELRMLELDQERAEAQKRSAAKKLTRKKKEHVMEVGKIIIKEQHRSTYSNTNEESISVEMSETNITLRAMHDREGRDRLLPTAGMDLTTDQAIELGQFLLKSAELQPEYAEAHKKLRDERTKVEARFKDMISGIGLTPDYEVDVVDERGTFKVVENIIEA